MNGVMGMMLGLNLGRRRLLGNRQRGGSGEEGEEEVGEGEGNEGEAEYC
jgi:hypothetical protein